jgi:hypothetical protein
MGMRQFSETHLTGVQTGHQRATRWCANRGAGVSLREAHPLCRQSIDVRRLNQPLSETAEIPVAQIIGKDENDVRLLARRWSVEPWESNHP